MNDPGRDLAIAVVIPARYGASRFPGKPLHPLAGRPMIAHVIERARRARGISRVIVATDDERIAATARAAGAEVAMTGDATSGSDRIAQAVAGLPDIDVVVNVQCDEPLIDPAVIEAVAAPFSHWEPVQVVTAARRFAVGESLDDPNRVKVVRNLAGNALYFSRLPIPWGSGGHAALLHIGIYAYWRNTLAAFAAWPPSALELSEKLEQLRLLEHGVPIRVVEVEWQGVAVDTPADAAAVEERLRTGNV